MRLANAVLLATFVLAVATCLWVERGSPLARGAGTSVAMPAREERQPALPMESLRPAPPHPFVDDEPDVVAADLATIEVVRENGKRLDDARINCNGKRVGDDGFATIESVSGKAAALRVFGWNFGHIEANVARDRGRHVLVIPDGSRVAGRILVDGLPPEKPIDLVLTHRDRITWNIPGGFAELPLRTTTTDGRFEFFNLPADWSGALVLPRDLALAADDTPGLPGRTEAQRDLLALVDHSNASEPDDPAWTFELDVPNPALELRLTRCAVVTGHVAPLNDGYCAALGTARMLLGEPDEAGIPWRFRADRNCGFFCVRVPRLVTGINLEIARCNGLSGREVRVEGPFHGTRDIGVVQLLPLRRVQLRVIDDAGAPIAGARAVVGGTGAFSWDSDAEGQTTINVDENVDEVVVGKAGYVAKEVSITPASKHPIDVVLLPAFLLRVELELGDGLIPPSGVYVELSSEASMFDCVDHADQVFADTGGSEAISESHSGPYSIGYAVRSERTVTVAGLQAGASILVELRTLGFGRVLDGTTVTVGSSGVSSVKLRAGVPLLGLSGTVRTASGKPVRSATVSVTEDGTADREANAVTDDEGHFWIPGITTPFVTLVVEKVSFSTLTERIKVPPDTNAAGEIQLVLAP